MSGRAGVRHRRPRGRWARARRASRPGRSPCSSSSSEAPPPVETWSTSVGEAELGERGGAVAAADDREAVAVGHGLGDGAGAGGEAGVLEHAHRAVPEHGAGLGDDVAELGGGAGADVEAHPAVGQVGARPGAPRRRPTGRRSCRPGPSAVMSCGQVDRSPSASSSAPAGLDLVGLAQRVADRVALGGEEREAHAAADDRARRRRSSSASMTPSLSLTLEPPRIATNGRLRVGAQAEEDLDLRGQQAAGGRRQRTAAARRSRRGPGATRRTRR